MTNSIPFLYYENAKYRGLRLNVLFHEGRYHVGEGFPPALRPLGIFTPEQLLEWLPAAIEHNAAPRFVQAPPLPIDLPIDIELDI